jgi:hypothetical protein
MKNKLLIVFMFGLMLNIQAQTRDNKVVLLMPFCSQLTLDNPTNSYTQLSNLSREYYQGALIALDSLEKLRIKIKFTVLDTKNDSNATVALLKKPAMKETELIIGPILQGGNRVVSNFVKEKSILHVSPLMTLSTSKYSDPNLISPNPNLSLYAKFIYQKIKEGAEGTIIIVSDKSSVDKTITAAFKQLQTQQKSLKIKVVDYGKGFDLQSYLLAGQMNHIVVATSSETVANKVLSSIKDTSLFSNTIFYGFPQWLEFKNPNYLLWEQANVRIASPFFVDYENEEVKKFITNYRERFFTEPTEAAFKGFDQVFFLCQGLNENGLKLKNNDDPRQMLGTTFSLKKQEDKSGYQNNSIYFIGVEQLKWKMF